MHSKDSATLIDYKTGEQSNSHYKQIKKYENILLEIGYKKIQKYLIYLSTSEIKEVK